MTVTVIPHGYDWTVDELDHLPDDGLQYELLDGILLVSPAPVRLHQRVVVQLVLLLAKACPPELEVLVAPVDWRPDSRTSLQPDVLVAPSREATAPNITDPLALAVEVLSPSTRTKDRTWKRQKYEEAGVRSFWIVDPDVPSIEAWRLVDGRFQLDGVGVGDDVVTLEHPYPVTLRPTDLIRR